MKYSIDTSSLITPWRFHYPPDRFPSVWRRLQDLIRCGDLRASPMVLAELERGEDELYKWRRAQADLCVAPDAVEQQHTRDIVRRYPGLVKPGADRLDADPFVIALAMRHGLAVVTQEASKGQGYQSKIPFICSRLGVRCIDILSLFADCGWTF